MGVNKAVFLDRDGVLTELDEYSEKNNLSFVLNIEEINIIPGAVESVRKLNLHGFKVFIVTNQPQIARGLIEESKVIEINRYVEAIFEKSGARIDKTFYCPHHPTAGSGQYTHGCGCRKPLPGMILRAVKEYELDASRCWMVGDRISDIKAGFLAGCKTIGVKTGYGCDDGHHDAVPDCMVKNIEDAVSIILKN
jgi:histidinol-phosphate phosphatase family protein